MHSRKDRILELKLDMHGLPVLVQWRGDVEHVQSHRNVDEQRSVRIVPSRANSGRATISMQIQVLSQSRQKELSLPSAVPECETRGVARGRV